MKEETDSVKVTMFGKPSSMYEWMKSGVMHDAKQQNSKLEIEEISDTAKFLEHNIRRIPAFKVNDRWILPDEDDHTRFLGRVLSQIAAADSKDLMQELIVPVDFSPASENAVNYAIGLAQDHKLRLCIVNVLNPVPHPGIEIPYDDQQIVEDRARALTDYVSDLKARINSDIPITHELLRGLAAEEIISKADEVGRIIVMGATGEGGYLKKWLGSVSTAVVAKASRPVLIIPHEYSYKSPEKLAYGGNNVELDIAIASQLAKFSVACNSSLEILHVDDKSDLYDAVLFRESLESKLGKTVREAALNGADKLETLHQFCIENNIDILAMSRERGNLLADVFRRSLTKAMAVRTKIPLLILHKL